MTKLPKGQEMFSMERLRQWREDPAVFKYVVNNFLSTVKGKKRFRKQAKSLPLSEILTPADEAFVILVIDHNYDRWVDGYKKWKEANFDKKKQDESKIKTKFTSGGSTRAGEGWVSEAIVQFNKYYKYVVEERETDQNRGGGKSYEETYMNEFLEQSPIKENRRVSKPKADRPAVMCQLPWDELEKKKKDQDSQEAFSFPGPQRA